jgi:hypothetical protein
MPGNSPPGLPVPHFPLGLIPLQFVELLLQRRQGDKLAHLVEFAAGEGAPQGSLWRENKEKKGKRVTAKFAACGGVPKGSLWQDKQEKKRGRG